MTKKTKMVISLIAVFCTVLLVLGIWGMSTLYKNDITFTMNDTLPDGTPDLAHYDSLSELKLGHLFAEEMFLFFD